MTNINLKFTSHKTECLMHIKHLSHALGACKGLHPLDKKQFDHLSMDQMAIYDQMIFRFTKLQDSIGNKLFNSGLSLLGEPVEQMTMIDKLHKLEKFSIISNASHWFELRELRNEFTHEYPEEDDFKVEALNALHDSSADLIHIFETFIQFVESKL